LDISAGQREVGLALALESGDTVKFNSSGVGIPVRIRKFGGTRVTASPVAGRDVYDSVMGQEIQITNPSALPVDLQVRHGFRPPPAGFR
jgi:hypothetical protein